MLHPVLDDIKTILVIGAHPDDIEIGCGGTLLRLLGEKSIHLHWVVLSATDEREQEARASAEYYLGQATSGAIEIEKFPDTLFPTKYGEIKAFFSRLREKVAPDLIFTHRREDRHQDHALTGEVTWGAFRNHLIFEYEIPKYEGDLEQPNVYVSLDKEFCARKVDNVINTFPSQKNRQWFSAETLWAMLQIRGVEADRDTQFAEAFHCRKLVI